MISAVNLSSISGFAPVSSQLCLGTVPSMSPLLPGIFWDQLRWEGLGLVLGQSLSLSPHPPPVPVAVLRNYLFTCF